MLTQRNVVIYAVPLCVLYQLFAMSELVWMSVSVKFFHLTLQLLQTFVEAQKQFTTLTEELEALKTKLASLEKEYGYDTVR